MSAWFCQLVDEERRCMEWDEYKKNGWDDSKSFPVEYDTGYILKKKEEEE
jgi:hypothetical protein